MEYRPPVCVSGVVPQWDGLPANQTWGRYGYVWRNYLTDEELAEERAADLARRRALPKRPLSMHEHHIEPSEEDRWAQNRAWSRHRRGWIGHTTGYLSRYEESRIKAWAEQHGPKKVYLQKVWIEPCCNDRDLDIGDIKGFRHRSLYMVPELYDEFLAMIRGFPVRNQEIRITKSKMTPAGYALLRGLNYLIVEGENYDVLSVEEAIPSTNAVMIKFIAG